MATGKALSPFVWESVSVTPTFGTLAVYKCDALKLAIATFNAGNSSGTMTLDLTGKVEPSLGIDSIIRYNGYMRTSAANKTLYIDAQQAWTVGNIIFPYY